MTTGTLLRELEPLTHSERSRRMVEVGRAAVRDAATASVLAELHQGGFYERWLAVHSCFGSRDGDRALRALSDASRLIRGLAIRLIPVVCNDAQAQMALETASFQQCRALLRRLLKRRRFAPIDAFLATDAAQRSQRLAAVLPFGSASSVGQHMEPVIERADQCEWRRLARIHPDFALEALRRRAEAAERLEPRLVWQANAALPVLAELRPKSTVDLVEALARHVPLAKLDLQRLAERNPAGIADLLLRSDDEVGIDLSHVAHRLDRERLQALVERRWNTVKGYRLWYSRLAPELRADLYAACRPGWLDTDGCLDHALVARLPSEAREQEGRRHLALPALATQPVRRLRYASFLPWDESRDVLDPSIRSPDADLRAAALSALAFATRFQRDRLSDLLILFRARSNEQDPVRGALLTALADLPPGRWRVEHLDPLGQIVRDALDAPDLSSTTGSAAERLVVGLVPFHPTWAAAWLSTMARERGHLVGCQLEQRLSDADVRRLVPDLLPVLRSWETREREGQLLNVAQSLGRRLRVFDGLVDLLERVLKSTPNPWFAERALGLIVEHRRERFTALVPELVRHDPSWVTRWVVVNHLHRHRQDLLERFLGQQAYRGRWSTGKTRFVLPLHGQFHRWTPRQQTIFARTLEQVTRDNERDSPTVLGVLNQLSALPAVTPTRLIELSSRRHPQPAVRDAALRALGRLDAGQGVPTLLEALGDNRARIAIYALRRLLLDMPSDQALALLRGVSLDQVTVAKEVVRLLGELPTEAAYRELLDLERGDLHRVVRIALLRALWSHLEQEGAWEILDQAAASPDAALASAVAQIPADRLSGPAQRRLALLMARVLTHPDPMVRMSALQRCAKLPVSDSEQVLLARLLEALNSTLPGERQQAARAVFTTYTGADAPLVGAAVKGLMADRRALRTALQELLAVVGFSRSHLLPTARVVMDVLSHDRLTTSLRVELAIFALPWDELGSLLAEMARSGVLHAEALLTAVNALRRAAFRSDSIGLAGLETTLAGSADERLRRLGLAALVAHAARGWNEERLARLRAYRADPSPLVAEAAQFTLPSEEETGGTS